MSTISASNAGSSNERSTKGFPDLKKLVSLRSEQERLLLEPIHRDFIEKTQAIFKEADWKNLGDIIEKQRRQYHLAVLKLAGDTERIEKMKIKTRIKIRDQLIKTYPQIAKLIEWNKEYTDKLETILGHETANVFHADATLKLIAELGDLIDYDTFEPPFGLTDEYVSKDNLEYNSSFVIPSWGVFGNNIEFIHENHGFFNPFSGEQDQKSNESLVALGINYQMPKRGALNISSVLKKLYYRIDYSINDYFGPSNAYLEIENLIVTSVEGESSGRAYDLANMVQVDRKSDGDDQHDSLSVFLPTFILNFRTDKSFNEGENVRILVTSYLRISSNLYLMKTDVNAQISWFLERIFVEVI